MYKEKIVIKIVQRIGQYLMEMAGKFYNVFDKSIFGQFFLQFKKFVGFLGLLQSNRRKLTLIINDFSMQNIVENNILQYFFIAKIAILNYHWFFSWIWKKKENEFKMA